MGSWFPIGRYSSFGWRLDIVSLLAVIGESSINVHAQEITASWLCLLPRLIPAPQALLRSSRPVRVQPAPACKIIGVYSGVQVDEINFFANIIHKIEKLKAFQFEVYHIELDPDHPKYHELLKRKTGLVAQDGAKKPSATVTGDPSEMERGQHANPQKAADSKSQDIDDELSPMVPPQTISPMAVLTLGSFLLTVGLFVWAALIGDGTALVSIGLISLASSLVGLGLKWNPRLAERKARGNVPKGNLVLRTRVGAFVVVKCNERVARELYIGPEYCDYVCSIRVFQFLSGTGTVLLMVSVILLGNCSWPMQAAIGGTYVLLNGLYWVASLLSKRLFWDLSRYKGIDTPITPEEFKNAHIDEDEKLSKRWFWDLWRCNWMRTPTTSAQSSDKEEKKKSKPNFTKTLWYAIQYTERISWVKNSGAAPATDAWDEWLDLAFVQSHKKNSTWDAEGERTRLMDAATKDTFSKKEKILLEKLLEEEKKRNIQPVPDNAETISSATQGPP